MKTNHYILFITFLLTCSMPALAILPAWSINPSQYLYSMTVTGAINIDGQLSVEDEDQIAAFVNGECRGKTSLKLTEQYGSYNAFLMVYSNNAGETVTFKVYRASTDTYFDMKNTIVFESNLIRGNLDHPFIWASSALSGQSSLTDFYLTENSTSMSPVANTTNMQVATVQNIDALVPTFTLPSGAKAYVKGEEQISSVSKVDFSDTVTYTVVSQDMQNIVQYRILAKNSSALWFNDKHVKESNIYTIINEGGIDNALLEVISSTGVIIAQYRNVDNTVWGEMPPKTCILRLFFDGNVIVENVAIQ